MSEREKSLTDLIRLRTLTLLDVQEPVLQYFSVLLLFTFKAYDQCDYLNYSKSTLRFLSS